MEITETTTQTTEVAADQQDAFLAGWDGDEAPVTEEPADQQEEQDTDAAQTEEAETTAGAADAGADGANTGADPKTTGEGADGSTEQQEQTAPQWVVKHMGEEKTIGAADITTELLQKGMDYDRIRGKYDEAKPVMEMFSEFAKKAGMSVTDYAKMLRVEAKKAGGVSDAEAKRAVELEDREAAVAAVEAQRQEAANAKTAQDTRIKADLAEFERAFPEVYKQAKTDPKVIPQSVWKDVGSGLSLTAAYSRYAVAKANETAKAEKEKAETAAQGQRNAARSTGSMKSAGNDSKNTDAFLEGFGD